MAREILYPSDIKTYTSSQMELFLDGVAQQLGIEGDKTLVSVPNISWVAEPAEDNYSQLVHQASRKGEDGALRDLYVTNGFIRYRRLLSDEPSIVMGKNEKELEVILLGEDTSNYMEYADIYGNGQHISIQKKEGEHHVGIDLFEITQMLKPFEGERVRKDYVHMYQIDVTAEAAAALVIGLMGLDPTKLPEYN